MANNEKAMRLKQEKKNKKVILKEREKYHKEVIAKEKLRSHEARIAPEGYFMSLRNVNKIYDNHVQAVFDFNLDIPEKEFVVLVGPSGCGKSTTLRMIAGLEQITSGDLFMNGKLANDLLPKERDIAMVFQSYALYPQMTVKENISFGLKINHYSKDEIEQRVSKAAEILQLQDYLDRKPGALSGGQCQRVALGRAIVRNSKLFLMDEPLSNLDAKLRVSMRSEIVKLHQRLGATTIYVTHDQTEAMTMATKVVVMDKGYIKQVGAPNEIYANPENIFVATFIGSPAMNLFKVKIKDNKVIFYNGETLSLGQDLTKRIQSFYKDEHAKYLALVEQEKDKYYSRYLKQVESKPKKYPNPSSRDEIFNKAFQENVEIQKLLETSDRIQQLSTLDEFDLTLGIRAENVNVTPCNENDKGARKVTVAELLGAEYFVHFDFSDKEDIVCKSGAKNLIKPGDTMKMAFDTDLVYLFDPITQNRIH